MQFGLTKWTSLTPALRHFSDGLFCGQQRLFVRMFAFESRLCQRQHWTDFRQPLEACCWEGRPTGQALTAFTRKFLGLFMINRFDILLFLEDAGLWLNRGERDCTDSEDGDHPEYDDDDETGDAAERKYAPATFEAAGLGIGALLRLLIAEGHYSEAELGAAVSIADKAADELPRCALLGAYLPGPLNVAKDLLLAKPDAEGSSPRPQLEDLEQQLAERYCHIAPRCNFRQACAAVLASDARVEHSKTGRMRVVSVEGRRRVLLQSAATCSAAAAAGTDWSEASLEEVLPSTERFTVEMDPEIGSLLLPGMTVTGLFSRLSDGTWYFAQPGYVWPSYYYSPSSNGNAEVDDEQDDVWTDAEEEAQGFDFFA